jgi:three-Cys-motif partner protein
LDPEGTELAWQTVASIALTPARRNKPELLILFPIQMGIVRLLTTDSQMSQASEQHVDRVFPSRDWRDVYIRRLAHQISPADAIDAYVQLYGEGLEGLGYRHWERRVISARTVPGGRERELYYLVFASDSDTGDRIMKDVMNRSYDLDFPVTRQPRLL